MPVPLLAWLTNAGAIADGWGLCTFRAGTSTAASTYTTAALTVTNSNPILFDSAGRANGTGVWLTPGESYKFVLKDFTAVVGTPTCIPDTGSTIWTVDNVPAVPGSASAVDVTATAAETIAAGDAVFISTGAGSLSQGQVYKTDADLTYKSTAAVLVGLAPNAITSGSTGTVRVSGAVPVTGPLTTGSPYYIGATAGAIVTTPPTNAVRLGIAQSTTSLVLGLMEAPVSPRGPPCGRLTLTSGTPVTTADVTAATTLYYTPAGSCNTIFLYDGTAWREYAFAELSIAVPATTSTLYDVFAYDNSGVVALELTAWTNDTTRATALALQNGVYSKTGALTRRYLGSFRTTAVSGQTEDSVTKRYVWNYDNRVRRSMRRLDGTNTWAYTTATWRQAGNSTSNQVDAVIGVAGAAVHLQVFGFSSNDTATCRSAVSIGLDSTTTPAAENLLAWADQGTLTAIGVRTSTYDVMPAVGRHFFAWLEYDATAVGTTTWYGDNGLTILSAGLSGWIEG